MTPNLPEKRENSRAKSLRERCFLYVVLLITAITYLGTFRFDFAFDDYVQILYNPFVKSWKYMPQYFVSSVWKQMSAVALGNYYRPIFMVWTRLNYALFSNRPLGWHVGAVLLHVIATWLVYSVVRKMTGRPGLAWMTALLFGVHPVHHEVVAWISGATESLFAIFFLAAFLAYLQFKESARAGWMVVSCGLYALALFSKETAIVLPALVFAHSWIADNLGEAQGTSGFSRRWVQPIRTALFYVPVVPVYLALRYKALLGFGHSAQHESVSTWLLTLPSILFFYLKHWLLPVGFAEFYDVYYQTHFNLLHVVLPVLILLAIGATLWGFRNRLGRRELAYAAAWIVIPLLPALDTFVFGRDELVHDRYFYVPSIGAALLIALIVERVARTKVRVFGQPIYVVATGLVLAVVLGLCATRASSFWNDDYSLYTRAHEIAPSNPTATVNLGAELIDLNDIASAQTLLESAYSKSSDDYHFAFNLGRLQYTKKQYPLAEEYLRKVISLNPIFPDTYVYLGQIELREGRAVEAEKNVRHAVELAPDSPVFRASYGMLLELNGDCADAMPQFESALSLNPGDAFAQREMFRCRNSLAPASHSAVNPSQP